MCSSVTDVYCIATHSYLQQVYVPHYLDLVVTVDWKSNATTDSYLMGMFWDLLVRKLYLAYALLKPTTFPVLSGF